MDASYRLILFLMLYCFSNLVFAQYYKDPKGRNPRISRFNESQQSCEYGWFLGVCRKRSECKITTARTCRSEKIEDPFDRIICCFDQQEPDPVKDIASSYPGCGFRSPKIQQPRAQISNTGGRGSRGKRFPTTGGFPMIVGGDVAKENSWPWMVSIRSSEDNGQTWNHACGASLISQNYVLTAAHCVPSLFDPSIYSVVVGAHTRNDGTVYPVKEFITHPDYKRTEEYHDIALIAVERPVELSKKVYPVCLPSDELKDKIEADNSNVTATGWGATSYGGSVSEELQEVTIPIVSLSECNDSYDENTIPHGIIKQQICAGFPRGGKDTCLGDSGGPLVSKLKDNSYVQIGVVSFASGCGAPYNPGVNTRVSQYIKWIYDNTDLGK